MRFFLVADRPRLRWVIWTGYVLLWTSLLVFPFPEGLELPLIEPSFLRKTVVAKTGHVCAYALMTILSAWLRTGFPLRIVLLFFLMAHASGTEWVQQNLANRTGTVNDVVLDHLGILGGLLLSWKWWTQ